MKPNRSIETGKLVRFFRDLTRLKELKRQGWLRKGLAATETESVADHSWAVSVLALVMGDGLDLGKVLALTLVHDLAEARTGDLTPADGVPAEEKQARERQAILDVTAEVDPEGKIFALWEEYEQNETPEARLARDLDKLEMALQAAEYAEAWGLDAAEFLESASGAIRNEELRGIVRQLRASPADL